jgi:sigma-E factor negative regulatory protein RseC
MKTDKGVVTTRLGDTVSVILQSHEDCASCSLAQFCVSSRSPSSTVMVTTSFDVAPGDMVEISIDDSLILKVSAIMYGVPLLGFLVGVFGGYGLSPLLGLQSGAAVAAPIVSGFVLLALGIIVSRTMARKLNVTGKVTRLIDEEVEKRL